MTLRLTLPLLAATLAALPLIALKSTAEPANRISGPLTHENVAVYFVHGPSAQGVVPDTLQEALAKGTIEVLETGNVQELKIRNTGATPVFVQFGDIVKGGQQDRVLTVSMLLEPNSGVVPIGAYCVEQGRWAARGNEDVKRFALSEALMPSRQAKVAMAKPESTEPRNHTRTVPPAANRNEPQQQQVQQGLPQQPQAQQGTPQRNADIEQRRTIDLGQLGRGGGQGEVWRSVSEMQSNLTASLAAPVASDKSRTSLQLSLEHEKLKSAQDAYLGALEPAGLKDDDIVGLVIAVNGELASADVYPSNGLFRKMWPKLVRAAATEALSSKPKPRAHDASSSPATAPTPSATPATAPTIEAVAKFLADAESGKPSERALGSVAKLETREAEKAMRLEARSASGAFVHRNYLAK